MTPHRLPLVSHAGFLAGILILSLASCDSGASVQGAQSTQGCGANAGNVLCLTSCNLGCSMTGCSVSDIAVNQPIILNFNQAIDPASVNSSTVSFRTGSGGQPVGDYVVRGQEIRFVPDIRVIGNVTSFGFEPGQRYALTLPGGPGETESLRSISGDRLNQTVSCFLNATKGVVDLDGKPPEATLISPVPGATGRINNLSTFVLEFSELIDAAPFQGTSTRNGPVTYTLFQTQKDGGGNLVCLTKPYEIAGTVSVSADRLRQRSLVTMQLDGSLPSEVCVIIEVTNRVRDLSNKPAVRTVFRLFTAALPPVLTSITENFSGTSRKDPLNTAARWGSGMLEPGLIGGRGELGEFVASDGRFLGESNGIRTYEWNTTKMTIPARRTYRNQDIDVTTGIFNFSSFVVHPNERVIWEKGTILPVQIFVRGKASIRGTVEVSGSDTPANFDGKTAGTGRGQPGSTGGPGGGVGGTGGDRPAIVGGSVNGRHGSDVVVHGGPGHPYYGSRLGTGGRGSPAFPPNAQGTPKYCYAASFSVALAAAGSGGGLFEDDLGTVGRVTRKACPFPPTCPLPTDCLVGDDVPPGTAFQILPEVPAFGSRALYMIGGSGGGGAGINPYFSVSTQAVSWNVGAGGAGGGGALVLRVGGDVEMGATGRLISRGGNTGNTAKAGYAAPGGGGSGGSVLIQCGSDNYVMGGVVDVKGGLGGFWEDQSAIPGHGFLRVDGGNGGAGYARLEATPVPSASNAGSMLPPASAKNVGLLTDRDFATGAQSLWYHTGKTFPPKILRYEIEAEVGGQPKKYSDDPKFGPDGPGTGFDPIAFFLQGAEVSQTTLEPDLPTVGKWVQTSRELEVQGPTGFRWMLIFDKEFLGPNVTIVVRKVTVIVEG